MNFATSLGVRASGPIGTASGKGSGGELGRDPSKHFFDALAAMSKTAHFVQMFDSAACAPMSRREGQREATRPGARVPHGAPSAGQSELHHTARWGAPA